MSTGPAGGNGAVPGDLRRDLPGRLEGASSTPPSRWWRATPTRWRDVYQRSGGTTTLVSTGALGGNGAFDAMYAGKSRDGTRVFFHTDEPLEGSDIDTIAGRLRAHGRRDLASVDRAGRRQRQRRLRLRRLLRRRLRGRVDRVAAHRRGAGRRATRTRRTTCTSASGAAITLVSTAGGGNADTGAFWAGSSENGSRVFFDTQEPLVGPGHRRLHGHLRARRRRHHADLDRARRGQRRVFSAFQGTTADGSRVFFHTAELAARGGHRRHAGRLRARRRRHDPRLAGAGERQRPLPGHLQGRLARRDARLLRHERAPGRHRDGHLPRHLRAPCRDHHVPLARADGRERGLLRVLRRGVGRRHRGCSSRPTRRWSQATPTARRTSTRPRSRPAAYPRPKGAGPLRVSLVPAYDECTAPNREHGPPLAYPSCNPPAQSSGSSRSARRTRTGARRTRSAPSS